MYTLMRFTEFDNPVTGDFEWLIRKDGCMHCEDPGCLKACPAPGAIVQYSNGIVDFIHENCIGCGYCVSGCPFDIPRISQTDHKSHKCTLCSDRVSVGQGPACAKACPTEAILFGHKEDMITHAQGRIEDLKSRGYENAGLYDPQGVGGTHVMYVLHHADQPQLYANLPENPSISTVVEGWKGPAKKLGLAAIGLAAVGSLLHGLLGRANKVEAEDEVHAETLVEAEIKPETEET
ncbi:formate dehydrogenase subunit beta [Paracoccus cavernae]